MAMKVNEPTKQVHTYIHTHTHTHIHILIAQIELTRRHMCLHSRHKNYMLDRTNNIGSLQIMKGNNTGRKIEFAPNLLGANILQL